MSKEKDRAAMSEKGSLEEEPIELTRRFAFRFWPINCVLATRARRSYLRTLKEYRRRCWLAGRGDHPVLVKETTCAMPWLFAVLCWLVRIIKYKINIRR